MVHAVKTTIRFRFAKRDESGAVLVIIALSITVIMGFAALVIDGGNARQAQRQGQAAADAAALAGAHVLSEGGSAATAESTAGKYITAYGYTSVKDIIPPVDGTHAGNANCIEVITSQVQPQRFSQVEKVGPITVAGRAVACANSSTQKVVGIISLDPSVAGGFQSTTSSTLKLQNGSGIFVDSNNPTAAIEPGGLSVVPSSASVDAVGGTSGSCGCTVTTGATAPTPTDPLAATATAPTAPTTPTETCNSSGNFLPGYYNCTLTLTGTSSFASGDYLITGGLVINAKNGDTITFGDANGPTYFTLEGVGYQDQTSKGVTFTSTLSTGVLFYAKNLTTCQGWGTTSNGDNFFLYPPASGNTDAGISVWVNSPASCKPTSSTAAVDFAGNAQGDGVTGIIYAPDGSVQFTANGAATAVGGIVADTVLLSGNKNSTYTVTGSPYSSSGPPFASLDE
jgi:hypothetical protein